MISEREEGLLRACGAQQERIAELECQLAGKDEALKDKERMDWLESHIVSSEPASYWSGRAQQWVWRWMGIDFETLRSAIDAAIKSGKDGK